MSEARTGPDRAVGIIDAGYCLPGEAVDLCDWGPRMGVGQARIDKLLANGCRYFHAAQVETDADLVTASVRQVLERSGVAPSQVAYLVHARTQNFSMPPAPHSLLPEVCARTGLAPRLAFAAGHLACASIVAALELAIDLLDADPAAACAMVTSSDRVFGGADHRLRQDSGIQSDGGSAILLGRGGQRAAIRWIGVRNFPRLHPGPSSPAMKRLIGVSAWHQTDEALDELCERAALPLAATAGLFPTNADMPYWKHLMARRGLDPKLLYGVNAGRRGHACCADLAVNLVDAGLERVGGDRPIVCFSQSNVGSYGCLVLEGAQP